MDSTILWFFGGVGFSLSAIAIGVVFVQVFGGSATGESQKSLSSNLAGSSKPTLKRAA